MSDAQKIRILSIDGGGIRGIIPASVLTHLESRLQIITGKSSTRIADHFDYVAGTSTGGIIALGLLTPAKNNPQRPRYRAQKLLDLYVEHGDEVFDTSFWSFINKARGIFDERYSADGLETLLKSYFENTRLKQLIRPCVIPTYMIDGMERTSAGKPKHKTAEPFFFRSHRAQEESATKYDFFVRDAARATSAAPTYFEPARVYSKDKQSWYALVDGGLYANDPTMVALTDVLAGESGADDPHVEDVAILSLGTGAAPVSFPYADAVDWGYLSWAGPAINMAMRGSLQTVHFQLSNLFKNIGSGGQYLRVNPKLSNDNDAMDDAREQNIDALKKVGKETIKKYEARIDSFIEKHLVA